MNNLKNAVGLLNAQAPKGEFLAYINPDEAKMLKDAGGSGLLTPQGIPSYFTAGQRAGDNISPGTSTSGGMRDSGGNNSGAGSQFTSGGNISPGTDVKGNIRSDNPFTGNNNLDEPSFTGEGYDATNTFEKPENKVKTFFNDIKDYVMSGGIIGKAFDTFGTPIQKKMMTYSLEKRIQKKMSELDLNNPNTMKDPKLLDLRKDLQGVQDGTFTQNNFTKKYGSGDVTNPNDKAYGTNPSALRENDIADIETYFAPELADIIGGTAPQESMVNNYFSSFNNQNLGMNSAYMDTYNKAKADMASKLQLTNNTQQYGYAPFPYQNNRMTMTSANPFFDELNNSGLI